MDIRTERTNYVKTETFSSFRMDIVNCSHLNSVYRLYILHGRPILNINKDESNPKHLEYNSH